MSTEHLRAKLTKAGYDEDEVFEMDRSQLLRTYAEYLLSPPIPESPEKAEGGMSAEELELKRRKEERLQQELELRKEELQMQRKNRRERSESSSTRKRNRRRKKSGCKMIYREEDRKEKKI